MRTRRGFCYPRLEGDVSFQNMSMVVKKRRDFTAEQMASRKRNRNSPEIATRDLFETLPDDLVISILCKLSSTASCPSDFTNVLITYVVNFLLWKIPVISPANVKNCFFFFFNVTDFVWNRCKRLNGLGLHSLVLSKASQKTFAIKAKNWSEPAQRFLKLCADAGNVEACYTLGMVSLFFLYLFYIF